jgi:hypothetical protein
MSPAGAQEQDVAPTCTKPLPSLRPLPPGTHHRGMRASQAAAGAALRAGGARTFAATKDIELSAVCAGSSVVHILGHGRHVLVPRIGGRVVDAALVHGHVLLNLQPTADVEQILWAPPFALSKSSTGAEAEHRAISNCKC